MEKKFIPYRERMGKYEWPNKARVAIVFGVAVEEWGEETMAKYGNSPRMAKKKLSGVKKADLGLLSYIEYGVRVGIWRLIEVFDRQDIKASIVLSGLYAEMHPEITIELSKKGHEIVAHGYDQAIKYIQLSEEEQREDIKKSAAILEKVTGRRPLGWISPGGWDNESTIKFLAEERFLYHGALRDDEIPYVINIDGKKIIEMPHNRPSVSGELVDYQLYGESNWKSGQEALEYAKYFFDLHYKEGARIPQYFAFSMHPYVSGRLDRAQALEEFIKYVKTFPDVWITRYLDIAEWWKEKYVE